MILAFSFITFLVLIFAISWRYFETPAERDVSNINAKDFPVVFIAPERSEIIVLNSLETYKRNNPAYSFLMPVGKEELINQQLEKSQREKGAKGKPQIRAKTISEGKQLIELEILGDGFFLSRYEATDKEVKPLALKMSGAGFVFLPCAATFFFGFTGFFLLRLILWFIRRKQNTGMV
ncbi:MAG TPA: hypothetical protein VF599_24615 [Pyrinomonadaceae bacterium]